MQSETTILYGKPVVQHIRERLKTDIQSLATKGIIPGLAVILVGEDPASRVYVRNKEKAFKELSCYSKTFQFSTTATETELINLIQSLNQSTEFHGILVQLPLPSHLNEKLITNTVSPDKDVDGFHPMNLGLLLQGIPRFVPCTPNGIIEMLKFYNITTEGKHVVILGRSNIVGKPMFALLVQKFKMGNSTVTVCHTKTQSLEKITKQADILIVASGVPHLVNGNMVKAGVHIIDVGINQVKDDSVKGYKLTGDVDYDSVLGIAKSISPVPRGVGPLTITMLASNTIQAAKNN
ncbi:MAG: bifunctional 5,10-methylenetetrahydrofolate dehydrogenase/5,10-methenyltetrahydrofolate cyclohydrolase [Candidatus Marinimicrobia bacterium]|nr:bifunctional 5,10-methylenetetrahydrofolate dehydrogenase/5,10-methenyltetrahydrofolate cyclohydrolase [Candidatus Neomarinimicrobiota bacterium]